MAEQSYFWDTNGTGDGATNYTEAQMAKMWRFLVGNGIVPGVNNLRFTGSTNTVSIFAGAASSDGFVYVNDGTVTFSVPSPSAGTTRIDRIVLRANWAAQTVRLTRIAGAESSTPVIPALIQNSGTTYDVPLYTYDINSIGAIDNVGDDRRPSPGIGSLVYSRVGGNVTDWSVPGTFSMNTLGNTQTVMGSADAAFSSVAGRSVSVLLPVTFAGAPLIQLTVYNPSSTVVVVPTLTSVGVGSFAAYLETRGGNTINQAMRLLWSATGQI